MLNRFRKVGMLLSLFLSFKRLTEVAQRNCKLHFKSFFSILNPKFQNVPLKSYTKLFVRELFIANFWKPVFETVEI